MARSHARVLTSIWSDKDFKRLSRNAQLTYFMLASQPDLGHSGLLSLTVRRWAGLADDASKETVWDALSELSDQSFVVVDEDTEELLIRTLVRNDGAWKQPKVLAVAINEAARISSPHLRACFCTEMEKIDTKSLPDKTREDVEALLKELPKALTNARLELPAEDPEDPPPHPPADPPLEDPPHPHSEGGAEGDRGTRAHARGPQPLPHSPAVPLPAGAADAVAAVDGGLFLVGDKPAQDADGKAEEKPARQPRQPSNNAADVIAAYVDGATDAGLPRPSEALRSRVGKQARKLLGENNDLESLIIAARRMGGVGWHDLSVQMQRDAAEAKERATSNGKYAPGTGSDVPDRNAYDKDKAI